MGTSTAGDLSDADGLDDDKILYNTIGKTEILLDKIFSNLTRKAVYKTFNKKIVSTDDDESDNGSSEGTHSNFSGNRLHIKKFM